MYDYKLQLTFKYKRPSLNVVVTNVGDKDHTVIYESHGDAYMVYVRVFNDKEISQRLNTLKIKIENNKKLSEIEVLDFAYVLMFAKENKAKIYSNVIVELFSEVENLDKSQQLDIHYVLKKLIRLHFRDDENQARELLMMITKSVHPDVLENMTTLEKALKKVEEKDYELSVKDDEISSMRNDLSVKDDEINKLRKKLKENNIEVD